MTIRYNPFDETLWRDPWSTYQAMREQEPAYFIEELNAWALTRFEDIWQASLNKTHFTAVHGTSPEALLLDENLPPRVFLFMDPPAHRHHRNLIAQPYTPAGVSTLEESIRATTRDELAPLLAQGELDVYRLASRVALRTIAGYIGLSFEQITHIRALIDAFYHREPGHRGTTPAGLAAFEEAARYIHQLVEDCRRHGAPANSHIDAWLRADIDGEPMSDEAIFFSVFALVITGSDTLPLTVAATLYYLSQQPEAMREVRENPALAANAFAEAARLDQPTNILGRVLTDDLELHGKTLHKGQAVLFLYASANRDEREFDSPDTYQLHRQARRNLSFGAGLHFCLGQHLAKLEGRVILEELFANLGDFQVDRDGSRRIFGEFLQGFNYLPVTFTPTTR